MINSILIALREFEFVYNRKPDQIVVSIIDLHEIKNIASNHWFHAEKSRESCVSIFGIELVASHDKVGSFYLSSLSCANPVKMHFEFNGE